jgi:hypothetical protein
MAALTLKLSYPVLDNSCDGSGENLPLFPQTMQQEERKEALSSLTGKM